MASLTFSTSTYVVVMCKCRTQSYSHKDAMKKRDERYDGKSVLRYWGFIQANNCNTFSVRQGCMHVP